MEYVMLQSKNGSLDNIGFYTLSDKRAATANGTSPMMRCEMILTNRCNFKCPYCRGVKMLQEDMPFDVAEETLKLWIADGLRNVRFSGGEPTLYPYLKYLVRLCKKGGVERIAISTNGSAPLAIYKCLIESGINDFSISLDACCSSFGDQMAGINGKWETVVDNIKEISKLTYVSVGVVLTEDNVHTTKDIIRFAHNLGVADIRIISAAQYNQLIAGLDGLEPEIIEAHPILKYRINNLNQGVNVRGICEQDCHKCYLIQDDSIVAGHWHFPCVIYMREGGKPIGAVGPNMRKERLQWIEKHNSYKDPICRKNCLDVCIAYNNKARQSHENFVGCGTT